ncbi:MAG: spore coat associated protein CotJA [Bacillota bacterium]
MLYPDYHANMMQNPNVQCLPMPKLAHAYVPFQCLGCIYPPMKGLDAGTIFPELDRPYGVDPEYVVDA